VQQLNDDFEAVKRLRLPWWGVLGGILGSVLVAFLFDRGGKLDLARPTLYTVAILGIAIAIKWNLRSRGWFWITMTAIAALHIPLILLVPWTSRWIPALMVIPFGIMDLFAMLALIALVGRLLNKKSTEA